MSGIAKIEFRRKNGLRNCYLYCGEGGFNNRFNVLLTGLTLVKKTKMNPIIIWQQTNQCGAEFTDIFDTNHQIYATYDHDSFFNNNKTLNIVHEIDHAFGREIEAKNMFQFNSIDEVVALTESSDKHILVHTNLRPSWVEDSFLITDVIPDLKFKKELLDICDRIIKENVGKNEFFGMHFRKTDFPNWIPNLESFMSDYISENGMNKFFVGSDDKATEDAFKKVDNVFIHEKYNYVQKYDDALDWMDEIIDKNGKRWPYNVNRTKENVIEAMVDMLILSKSTIVETVIHSTFLQNSMLLNSYWKSINGN
jgi:hypothetical protein